MKKYIYSLLICTLVLITSCTEEVEFSSTTEALGDFQIVATDNTPTFSLNSGTPDKTVTLSWTAATPGVNKVPTYTVLFFTIDSENAFFSTQSDNNGLDTKATLLFSTIDSALESAGFAAGETASIQWQVVATNGDVETSTSKVNANFVRFASDGLSEFNLLNPDNNKVITADIYVTPNEEVNFSWEAPTTTSGSGTISYKVLFDKLDGDFSEPLYSFDATSTSFVMSHQEIGNNFGDTPNMIWTVKAQIDGTEISLIADQKYINWDIFIINEFYLVGSVVGWDNTRAIPFTDKGNGAFELRVNLNANDEFKFLPQLGSWDGDWGEDPANPGKIIQDGEQNLKVTEAGTYIIKVDFQTLSVTVEAFRAPDNLYMVGSHNGWNNADLTQQFNNDGNGVFTKVQQFSANSEFKMIPTSGSWDGDWGEDPNNPGKIIQDGEQNIKVANAGTYLVIVDFNTQSFHLENITTMNMVGSHNGWNNADANQAMYTSGNGIFTKIQTFDANAEFKMVPVSGSWDNDWGEDPNNSGKLVKDGEQNIKVSSAGTYMVSLDFNTLSFTLLEVPSNLYLVGSPNGWNNATAPEFTKLSEGVFEISLTLTASDEFKFLPQQGAWTNDWGESSNYPGMIVRENEQNVKSPGNGTYTVTVDFNKGTVTVL